MSDGQAGSCRSLQGRLRRTSSVRWFFCVQEACVGVAPCIRPSPCVCAFVLVSGGNHRKVLCWNGSVSIQSGGKPLRHGTSSQHCSTSSPAQTSGALGNSCVPLQSKAQRDASVAAHIRCDRACRCLQHGTCIGLMQAGDCPVPQSSTVPTTTRTRHTRDKKHVLSACPHAACRRYDCRLHPEGRRQEAHREAALPRSHIARPRTWVQVRMLFDLGVSTKFTAELGGKQ